MATAKIIDKEFILQVLKYGLSQDELVMIDCENVIVRYNGGENWNCRYCDDWHDVYIPISLPRHKIFTKKVMESEMIPIYDLDKFESLTKAVKNSIGKHFEIYETDLTIGKNKLYLNLSIG